MSVGFETPNYNALVAEQALVQADKIRDRRLDHYNQCIFPGQAWQEPRSSAIIDFVQPFVPEGEEVTLGAVLRGVALVKEGRPVSWVDMGGGRALPMRQLASVSGTKSWLQMTNVDLFNFGPDGLTTEETDYLEGLAQGMTSPETGPHPITGNVETVKLPGPADIITSIEVMQYLNNPLEALANWYNQLAENGIMIVATEHDWSYSIRYQREPDDNEQDETPTKHVLEALAKADINFAATYESDWEDGHRPTLDPSSFRIMAVQKKPGTSLIVTRPVTKVLTNPWKYKAAYYELSNDSMPIVEVISSAAKNIGGITLGSVC